MGKGLDNVIKKLTPSKPSDLTVDFSSLYHPARPARKGFNNQRVARRTAPKRLGSAVE
jgi:hypothetical protein